MDLGMEREFSSQMQTLLSPEAVYTIFKGELIKSSVR